MPPRALGLLLGLCGACVGLACRDLGPQRELPSARHRLRELAPAPIRAISARDLCVTSGRLHATADARWVSMRPAFRATAVRSAGHHAAVQFRYLGGAEHSQRLGSAVSRRQLGLKLLSRDSCNAVYAMWRFDEPASVVASIKANRDFARRSECGDRGYRNLRPRWMAPVELPRVGSVHQLSATLQGGVLEVRIDQRPVLRAFVSGPSTPSFGASGLRSDNVRFELMRFEADVPEGREPRLASCGS